MSAAWCFRVKETTGSYSVELRHVHVRHVGRMEGHRAVQLCSCRQLSVHAVRQSAALIHKQNVVQASTQWEGWIAVSQGDTDSFLTASQPVR